MKFMYHNHRGESEVRDVTPIALQYCDDKSHIATFGYQPGWFLYAYDNERKAHRTFSLDVARMEPIDGYHKIEIGDLKKIEETVKNLEIAAITPHKSNPQERPLLGLATTAELLAEIAAREKLGHMAPSYKTANGSGDGLDV